MKKVAILLSLGAFLAVSCVENGQEPQVPQEPQVSKVNFTPCQHNNLRSSEISNKVDVQFTNEGVQIMYKDFEVTCDFSTVNVTHTFVNGFLNISQKGFPNLADCICYSDVSYTIKGISKKEVNVIFINGKQVYCYNDNKEEPVKSNVDALNQFAKDNQYYFTPGYIFNEYANEDLIISYMPNNKASTLRGFAIARKGVVYNTAFHIPQACYNGIECIWNGNYVTVAIIESGNDESTGLYGFQVNNEDLSQPAVELWRNTDVLLRWLKFFPFSEKINGNYFCAGERNCTYRSSFRCNMATGEVLFTDAKQVHRVFMPVVYANGIYYGTCGNADKFCIASASQYYNNTTDNTLELGTLNIAGWNPVLSFDFAKRRSVVITKINQLCYPVFLNNSEADMSVPGLSGGQVYKYKNKCYTMQDNPRLLVEKNDASHIFDDKYLTVPTILHTYGTATR